MTKLSNHTVQAITAPMIRANRHKSALDTIEKILVETFQAYEQDAPVYSHQYVVENIVERIRAKLNNQQFAKGACYKDYK